MILRIAWRNILRNKRRSLILIISIVVGVIAIVLTQAFVGGMMEQMLTNQIGTDVGYVQIHRTGYQVEPGIDNSMAAPDEIRNLLIRDSASINYSERLKTFGLVSSAYNSSGVSIVGIIPKEEKRITTMSQYVVGGKYLADAPDQILVSTSIAEKLKVGIGDKIVIMASQLDGSVGSEACRVCGIYETFNSGFDQSHLYVSIQTLRQMLNVNEMVSEFVINPMQRDRMSTVLSSLRKEVQTATGSSDKYEIMSYAEMLPLFVMQIGLYNQIFYIVYIIIGIALIFGIIDVMLMAVMERTHEFGVSMAIGMSNKKIFRMILAEALFLGITGTVLGLGISYAFCLRLAHTGWDLSVFSASLRSFGAGSKIFPVLDASTYIKVLLIIPLVTVFGAVYPAAKAIRLQPVEAIRAA